MGFKRATQAERESEVKKRTKRGLSYVKSDIPIFQPMDGDNQIRIVPPLSEDVHASLWGLEVWACYINNKSFLSPKTFDSNATDPIAEHFFELRETDPEAAKKFRATKRHLMFVLDLNDELEELKLWAAPPTLIDDILKLAKNRRTGELIALEDPEDGRAIYFTKTGKGIGTKYSGIEVDSQTFKLEDDLADDLELFVDMLAIPKASELSKLIASIEAGEEDEEAPAPRRTRKRQRPTEQAPTQEEETDFDEDEIPFDKGAGKQPQDEPKEAIAEIETDGADDMRSRVRQRLANRNKAKK